jgi:hypothetical protein
MILAGLQQKFAGVDTAILSRIAAKKAEGITDETKVNSIVEGIAFADVLNSYGDFRAGESARTSVANYEKKYGLKDGSKVETTPPTPPTPPIPPVDTPDISKLIADAVNAAIKPLNDQLEAAKTAKAAEARAAQVIAKAKEYGIPESQAKRYNISPDADLDAYFKDVKQEYQNMGFEGNKPPESAEQRIERENAGIASMITDGTKAILDNKK